MGSERQSQQIYRSGKPPGRISPRHLDRVYCESNHVKKMKGYFIFQIQHIKERSLFRLYRHGALILIFVGASIILLQNAVFYEIVVVTNEITVAS